MYFWKRNIIVRAGSIDAEQRRLARTRPIEIQFDEKNLLRAQQSDNNKLPYHLQSPQQTKNEGNVKIAAARQGVLLAPKEIEQYRVRAIHRVQSH